MELIALAAGLQGRYEGADGALRLPGHALVEVFKLIGRANKYIDENKPWALARTRPRSPAWPTCSTICWSACAFPPYCSPPYARDLREDLRPARRGRGRAHLGVRRAWGLLPAGAAVSKGGEPVPPHRRGEELAALDELQAEARRAALPAVEVEPFAQESVDFDTFCKSDFRAVKVKACESVKKSAKLLRFTLDDGSGTDRQILSGIAMYYKPEELVGKTLVAIINLPPQDDGAGGCGMLLSAVHRARGGRSSTWLWWTAPSRRRQAVLSASCINRGARLRLQGAPC